MNTGKHLFTLCGDHLSHGQKKTISLPIFGVTSQDTVPYQLKIGMLARLKMFPMLQNLSAVCKNVCKQPYFYLRLQVQLPPSPPIFVLKNNIFSIKNSKILYVRKCVKIRRKTGFYPAIRLFCFYDPSGKIICIFPWNHGNDPGN